MRYRGGYVLSWGYGKCCYFFPRFRSLQTSVFPGRLYCTHHESSKKEPLKEGTLQQRTADGLRSLAEVGRQWGHNSVTTALATLNYWWEKYEEFVGLTEVREAQTKVTEAEKAFMVARGMVREAHGSLETLQGRLKEVRDRLDRVSREEAHYLELATLEHKLLQEERRLRTTYENAEEAEREKFALFSAAVRESHEKERARAERTKNWSVIGSVLGALIGVMGSTYVNRVRLQELKNLLLEAQKGPVSLQEAIKVQDSLYKTQQEELRGLINTLRGSLLERTEDKGAKTLPVPVPSTISQSPLPSDAHSVLKDILLSTQKAQTLMEGLKPPLVQLEQTVGKMQSELQAVKRAFDSRPILEKPVISPEDAHVHVFDAEGVMQGLAQTEKRLKSQINKTSVYNTVLTYTAFAITLPLLYLLFKSN
ncbi:mitochondrial potassium channel [Scleropages formosus]|uniref:Coiled-coil domain containing 51 n=1 Tax=Scleropages formosus TaxID=113540 RepID=A0A8C9RF70_SCLFO|nr:coiled-coil domain-containing protein 51 [Scleropages formosus]XP_018602402.2 coiled-coil domain-containing protein 51 [Scleropages formosus]XP_018602408.2 coiled-coil domain-containing protein 51 [Scleropages formosus]XP_018602415.2 coiled-coil domain-containing protein 51 [Scleropages formosus]